MPDIGTEPLVRVFDIRKPKKHKKIACFNPPAGTTPLPGIHHARFHPAGKPGWCSAPAPFDREERMLYTICQDSGLMALEFREGAWPFKKKKAKKPKKPK